MSADAHTIIESFSGTVSPAGTAVRLITDMVDDIVTFRPRSTGIELCRDIFVGNKFRVVALWHQDCPVGVNNGSHKALDFLKGSTFKLLVDSSNPSRVRIRVNPLDVLGEVKRGLSLEVLHDIELLAKLDVLASLLRLSKVNQFFVTVPVVDTLVELGELVVEHVKFFIITLGGEFDDGFAEFADIVVLSEVVVDLAGVGNGGDGSES